MSDMDILNLEVESTESLNSTLMGVALFFPYERKTKQVRMPGSVYGPPHFGPLMTFFGFFLLNLGSTAPDYSRRLLMRSSKAPSNQKNRGQVLPQPTRTH